MTLASSWSTSSSPRWSVTPSTPTCSPSRPCWRSRPKSIRTTRPRTPSCAAPRACSPPRTSDRRQTVRTQTHSVYVCVINVIVPDWCFSVSITGSIDLFSVIPLFLSASQICDLKHVDLFQSTGSGTCFHETRTQLISRILLPVGWKCLTRRRRKY